MDVLEKQRLINTIDTLKSQQLADKMRIAELEALCEAHEAELLSTPASQIREECIEIIESADSPDEAVARIRALNA